MEPQERNSAIVRKLCWFFIIAGLFEIFYLIFITHNLLAIFPGLITIIPAYFTLHKNNMKRKYFVGIWPLIKFNPIGLAMFAFILGDFFSGFGYSSNIFPLFMIIFLPVGLLSVAFGIVLIIKISKHNKFISLASKPN